MAIVTTRSRKVPFLLPKTIPNRKFSFSFWKRRNDLFPGICDLCDDEKCHRHVYEPEYLLEYECLICFRAIVAEELIVLECGHSNFCPPCIEKMLREEEITKKKMTLLNCPNCRSSSSRYLAVIPKNQRGLLYALYSRES